MIVAEAPDIHSSILLILSVWTHLPIWCTVYLSAGLNTGSLVFHGCDVRYVAVTKVPKKAISKGKKKINISGPERIKVFVQRMAVDPDLGHTFQRRLVKKETHTELLIVMSVSHKDYIVQHLSSFSVSSVSFVINKISQSTTT